jgi:8-oxo-dGTP diphosphatase
MQPRNAAGGIIVNSEGNIALVWQNGNSWSFPKGGIDAGEDVFAAALREIEEETGLHQADLVLKGNLGSYMRRSIARNGIGEDESVPESSRTLYLFYTNETVMHPQDKEVSEARFVPIDQALELLTHPKDREFLASVRSKVEAVIK